MHRSLRFLYLIVFLISLAGPVHAQSLPKDKQAEVAIEIQMDRLRDNPLFDQLKSTMENAPGFQQASSEFDFETVEKVFMVMALPEKVADFEAMQGLQGGDDLPMEMYVRMTFTDAEAAEKVMDKVKEDSVEKTIDGVTYVSPKSEGPKNMIGHMSDDTTMVFGTETYVTRGGSSDVLSAGLAEAWSKMPNDGIRICVDLQNSRELIEEAVAMAKENGDPMMGGMVDLALAISNIRLSMDLAGGNLLTIGATGTDAENAKKFSDGLNGLLAMAKMGGQQGVQQLSQQNPEAGRVLGEILKALNAKQDGDDILVEIPKPEGFEDVITGLLPMMGPGF
jgi:hypothetical protein